jgi:hypothetical protein
MKPNMEDKPEQQEEPTETVNPESEIDLILNDIQTSLEKEVFYREQIKAAKNQLIEDIEKSKQKEKQSIDKFYQKKSEGIQAIDIELDEAISAGDVNNIQKLLESLIEK